MKEKLKDIKNRIYEVEGLLELAQQRGDKIEDLLPLIVSRLEEVRDTLANIKPEPKPEPKPEAVLPKPVFQEIELQEEELPIYNHPEEEELEPEPEEEEEELEPEPDELEPEEPEEPEPEEPEEEPEEAPTPTQPKDVKSLFCLNDRFKFRRMIFGGSDADFNKAMDALGQLRTLAEAEDYFYNGLGLDSESAEVQEFMAVIKNHYGK